MFCSYEFDIDNMHFWLGQYCLKKAVKKLSDGHICNQKYLEKLLRMAEAERRIEPQLSRTSVVYLI